MASKSEQDRKRQHACAQFRQLMESRPDLTQSAVARLLNTTRATINKYVHGQVTPRPSMLALFKARLREQADASTGHALHDRPAAMDDMERQIILALRRVEAGRRARVGSAVRELLLAAAPPTTYAARRSGSGAAEEIAAAIEREVRAGLQHNAPTDGGAMHEPPGAQRSGA